MGGREDRMGLGEGGGKRVGDGWEGGEEVVVREEGEWEGGKSRSKGGKAIGEGSGVGKAVGEGRQ